MNTNFKISYIHTYIYNYPTMKLFLNISNNLPQMNARSIITKYIDYKRTLIRLTWNVLRTIKYIFKIFYSHKISKALILVNNCCVLKCSQVSNTIKT